MWNDEKYEPNNRSPKHTSPHRLKKILFESENAQKCDKTRRNNVKQNSNFGSLRDNFFELFQHIHILAEIIALIPLTLVFSENINIIKTWFTAIWNVIRGSDFFRYIPSLVF